MGNVLYFDVYKNTLKRVDGLPPVNGERGYSQICCRFRKGDWAAKGNLLTGGFFVNSKQVTGVEGRVAEDESGVLSATFAIPSAILRKDSAFYFAVCGSYDSGNMVVVTNAVRIDVARGMITDNITGNEEIISRYDELMATLNSALAAKANKPGYGSQNEIIDADGYGNIKRSGFSISTNENVIADRDNANAFIPNARAVAKVINAAKAKIPSKTSQLQNDSGFLTEHQDISGKVDKADIPNNKLVSGDGNGGIKTAPYSVTDYAEDIEFANRHGLPNCKAVHDSLEIAKEETVNTVKAKIPSKTSQLQNDSGFLTKHQDISGKEDTANKVASVVLDADITAQDEKNYVAAKVVKNLFRIVRNTLIPNAVNGKADKATTLAGYGIANAYTKEEADAAVDKNRAELTGGAIVPDMERGSIRNNPTDYIPTNNYIRTKQGFSMWLNPGAVIGLSDYSNAQFFVWLTRPDGTFAKSSVMTGDYIVKEFGFYQLVASHNPVAALTDAEVAALIASIRIQNTAVSEQGAQAPAPLLLGRHKYDYPFVGFNSGLDETTGLPSLKMTIPRNSRILLPGGSIDLGSSALNVECIIQNKNSTKIVYNKATKMVEAIEWDSEERNNVLIAAVSYRLAATGSEKTQITVSINAPYRINNRCADMPFSEVLAPIAIGYDINQRRNYVEVDTVNKTITFPARTLIFAGEANGFVSVNNGSQLVVGYSDIPLDASSYYGVIKLYFNTVTKQIFISPRNSIQFGMYPLVAIVRVPQTTTDTTLPSIAINAPAVIDNHFGGFIDQRQQKNGLIKQISHRGYNTQAPENTLPAFRLAKKMGFDTIETDVQRTADGKYICIHDGTINERVAQNAEGLTLPVNIADITLEQAQQYDVGRVKGAVSEKYQGTRIPTLEEALQLCRAIGLKMYVELKRETLYTDVSAADQETYVRDIMRIIHTNGMSQHVAIYSGVPELLGFVKSISPGTTLIYGCEAITSAILNSAIALKSGANKVVLSVNDANCQKSTDNIENHVAICASNGIQMGAWFANYDGSNQILNAHPYVSGFMCNSMLPGNILYDNSIN